MGHVSVVMCGQFYVFCVWQKQAEGWQWQVINKDKDSLIKENFQLILRIRQLMIDCFFKEKKSIHIYSF